MSGAGVRDWSDVGIWPLQDHDPKVEIDMRAMLVGARVASSETDIGLAVVGKQNGMGTIGDVHPWRFWQTVNRSKREMGSWSMAFPAVVVGGKASGPFITPGDALPGQIPMDFAGGCSGGAGASRGGSAVAQPIRKDDYRPDTRYSAVAHKLPDGVGPLAAGTICIAMAGTDERKEYPLLFPIGGQPLVAVNWSPPGSMGSEVADLEPAGQLSKTRVAKLQSAWRVVRMPDSLGMLQKCPGHGLAWQLTASQQDSLAGYGMAYGPVQMGGSPVATPRSGGGGQTTPSETNRGVQPGLLGGSVGPGNVPGANPDPHHPNKWAGTGPGVYQ